jgi:hypothetical protein
MRNQRKMSAYDSYVFPAQVGTTDKLEQRAFPAVMNPSPGFSSAGSGFAAAGQLSSAGMSQSAAASAHRK